MRHILPATIETALRLSLLYSGSMTQYLTTLYQSPLTVAARLEQRVPANLYLQHHFDLPRYGPLWQRDVILSIEKKPVMFARSYMPYATAKSVMHQMGDTPLGTWLFSLPSLRRSPFMYFQVSGKALAEYELLHAVDINPHENFWGRQSDFILPNGKLMLVEVFL